MSRRRQGARLRKYSLSPERDRRRVMTTSWNATGSVPSSFEKCNETSATFTARRADEPWKITSSIFAPRSRRARCSPSTQRTASDTFDLPQPFGPTIAVTPGLNTMSVVSANDLKPCSSSLVSRTRTFSLCDTRAPAEMPDARSDSQIQRCLLERRERADEQPRRSIVLLETRTPVGRDPRMMPTIPGTAAAGQTGVDQEGERQSDDTSARRLQRSFACADPRAANPHRLGRSHAPLMTLNQRALCVEHRRKRRRRQILAVLLQLQDSARLRVRGHQLDGECGSVRRVGRVLHHGRGERRSQGHRSPDANDGGVRPNDGRPSFAVSPYRPNAVRAGDRGQTVESRAIRRPPRVRT